MKLLWAGVLDIRGARLQKFLEPLLEPRFDLAHPLTADSMALTDLLKRARLFGELALAEDLPLLVLERVRELLDLLVRESAPLRVSSLLFRIGRGVRQDI